MTGFSGTAALKRSVCPTIQQLKLPPPDSPQIARESPTCSRMESTLSEMMLDIAGRDVLLIDDIFDTGRTINHLVDIIMNRGIDRENIKVVVHDYKDVGGVLASLVFAYVLSTDAVATTVTRFTDPPVDTMGAIIGEALFTMIFVMAVLVLSKSTSYTKYLGIGFTLVAVHLVFLGLQGWIDFQALL